MLMNLNNVICGLFGFSTKWGGSRYQTTDNGIASITFLVAYHPFVAGNGLPVTHLTQIEKYNLVN